MYLNDLTLAIILSIICALLVIKAIPILVRAAYTKQLLDHPADVRKIHKKSIPALGGIAFISVLWLTYSLHPLAQEFQGYNYLLSSSIILFIVGIKDDLYVVDPFKKLLAQLLAAGFMIFGGGIYIQSFGGVFGIESIPFLYSVLLTIFVFIVVINALNLIDGVDSLAASITIFSSLFFGYWFWKAGDLPTAFFCFVFASSLTGFLWHNREPARIFMGDAGSLVSGFYLAVLGIKFLNSAVSGADVVSWQSGAPVILVAVLIVPLYDTLRAFTLRVANGKSPFFADANHVHHHLLNEGLTHTQVTLTLIGFQAVILTTAIILSHFISVTWLLAVVVGMSILMFPTVSLKRRMFAFFLLKSKYPFSNIHSTNGDSSLTPPHSAELDTLLDDEYPESTQPKKEVEKAG